MNLQDELRCRHGHFGSQTGDRNTDAALEMLESMGAVERDALVLYYAKQTPLAQVLSQTGLTQQEFVLLRLRARRRFSELTAL